MRSILLAASLALAPAAYAADFHFSLPPGISGAWYNPAQSGHGLTVEILDGNRALVFWHVFDPDGDPVHLYIEGDVVGETILGQAYVGRGMRFGSFDPAQHTLEHWGSVVLAFSGCGDARLDWQADGPAGTGYADGSMPLQRLTLLAGLRCEASDFSLLPAGSYKGALSEFGAPVLHGAVDRDGTLWVMQGERTPSGPYVGPDFHVIHGLPAGERSVEARFHGNYAMTFAQAASSSDPVLLRFAPGPDGLLAASASTDAYWTGPVDLHLGQQPPAADPLLQGFDLATLDGAAYAFLGRSQFLEHWQELHFTADGRFCLSLVADPCAMEGRITGTERGMAMARVEVTDGSNVYVGRLWVDAWSGGMPQQLVLVAVADASSPAPGLALGLVAERP